MQTTPASDKWDNRFLALADQIATWSKDPSRGVGAVIVSGARQIVATGFNGLPRGVHDLPERLERPAKYDYVCHAELNAIIQCARNGVSPVGCTIYTSFSPCVQCTLAIVQAWEQGMAQAPPPLPGGSGSGGISAEESTLGLAGSSASLRNS